MRSRKLDLGSEASAIHIDSRERYLAVRSMRGALWVHDLRSGALLWRADYTVAASFAPGGQTVAVVDDRSRVRILRSVDGLSVVEFDCGSPNAVSICFTADGRRIVVSFDSGVLGVWRVADRLLMRAFEVPINVERNINELEYRFLVHGGMAPNGRELRQHLWSGEVCLATSSCGAYFAAGFVEERDFGDACIFRATGHRSGRTLPDTTRHGTRVSGLVFSPSTRHLALGTLDRQVVVYSVQGHEELARRNFSSANFRLWYSRDGSHLIAHDFRTATVWDTCEYNEVFSGRLADLPLVLTHVAT